MEPHDVEFYAATYGGFETDLYAEIRREAFVADVGQNSWTSREELDDFARRLNLEPSSRLLEVACGSGGPALHVVRSTGCSVAGVDVDEAAIANATRMAEEAGLASQAAFMCANASQPLRFDSESFTALLCVDAINHLPGRRDTFAEWARVLRPGSRLLFTDPITVTGALGSDEIATRASIGYFLFVPHGEDARLLEEAGLRVLDVEDATEAMASVAERWLTARAKRDEALRAIEGDETFAGQQRFLEVAATLARERRLSRFIYLAEKPH